MGGFLMVGTKMEYEEFLKSKRHIGIKYGINPIYIPNKMFDFQRHITTYAIEKGRCAGFIDTGLGKTLIELTIAANYEKETNKNVLIVCPLAVAFQFIEESNKFNLTDISYSKDGKFKTKVVICNYERLHYFDPSDFETVILDESSILKNFEGQTKKAITEFLKKVKYRFLFTATPSPNDYIELGTSSEALGYLGYTDMLQKFFKNNNNNTVKIGRIAIARQGVEWYLKPYAENDFWRWVSSWSISVRKPSDLGYDDSNHVLPTLHEIKTVVANKKQMILNGQHLMFNFEAKSFAEVKAEVRATIEPRCEMAVSKSVGHETSVYWVNLNDEAKIIKSLDKTAKEVHGSMSIDEKEEILIAFSKKEIKKLITKTSITAFGLNWQHCNHTTYFPTYSYEQYYQAIRRFWRFGQEREVHVDLILSDGQTKVMESLEVKKEKAIQMFENLTKQTNTEYTINRKEFDKKIILPSFIKG